MKKRLLSIIFIVVISTLIFLVSCEKTTTVNYYTVSLDANGGVVDTDTIQVTKGDKLILPTPIKDDKNFLGWYTELDINSIKIESETVIDKDYTLYALWDKYDITFLDGDNNTYYTETIECGLKANNPSKFPVEKREDNSVLYFDGWDFNFQTPIYKDYIINSKWSTEKLTSIRINLGSIYNTYNETIDIPYRDSYFLKPNTEFNKDLALYAFGSANANRNKSNMGIFITKSGFDNAYYSASYSSNAIEDIAYAFSHRTINDFELISVSIKGFGYGMQWVDNFNVGSESYHKGFNDRAIEVVTSLKEYINEYYSDKTIKLLVTGYSRAGAIANIVSQMLTEENSVVSKNNIYAYTFEAPKGLDESTGEYPNIFNIVNGADIVAQILPSSYGSKRAGIDINTFDPNIDSYISVFNKNIVYPKLNTTSSYYNTEEERALYIINTLTKESSNSSTSLSTKTQFYNNYQESIMYVIELSMTLKDSTLNRLMDKFKNEVTSLIKLTSLKEEDKIYDMVKPIIDSDGITYDDAKLKKTCNDLSKLIFGPAYGLVSTVLGQYIATKNTDSISRLAFNHDVLCNYILLNNYNVE